MGTAPGKGPEKYSKQHLSLLRNGCEKDKAKLELVDSLEYWANRLKACRWHEFAKKEEARKYIAQYEKWMKEDGIKEKYLPPPRAIAPFKTQQEYLGMVRQENQAKKQKAEDEKLFYPTRYSYQDFAGHKAPVLEFSAPVFPPVNYICPSQMSNIFNTNRIIAGTATYTTPDIGRKTTI